LLGSAGFHHHRSITAAALGQQVLAIRHGSRLDELRRSPDQRGKSLEAPTQATRRA
jgi:hypothetical protein